MEVRTTGIWGAEEFSRFKERFGERKRGRIMSWGKRKRWVGKKQGKNKHREDVCSDARLGFHRHITYMSLES